MFRLIIDKLKDRTAGIGIIGLGYVGLPLALRFSEIGYKVIGFDILQDRVNALNAGTSHIEHIASDQVTSAVHHGFKATTDLSLITTVDAIILCLPTPLNKYREPDLSFVLSTMDKLLPFLRSGQILSLESTTYPGTTEEELQPRIESQGFHLGENYFLVFSPEREDPGNPEFNSSNIPKVCGGITEQCLAVGTTLYEQIVPQVIPVSSTRTAEMTKLLENIHRAVNIGLVNELKQVAIKMNIDIFEVIEAAATKPFGFVPYYPGPGIGGHCIPIDPFYLTWKAREYGMHTRFIELAGEINSGMPSWVIERLMVALNQQSKALKGSHILILGLAYKKNVDDMRESPSLALLELLNQHGAHVEYSDPHVKSFIEHHGVSYNLSHLTLTPQTLARFDAVILATAHQNFDYDLIQKHSKLIIDTRGKYHRSCAKNIIHA